MKKSEVLRKVGKRLADGTSNTKFICCEISSIMGYNRTGPEEELRQFVVSYLQGNDVYDNYIHDRIGKHPSEASRPFLQFMRSKLCEHLAEQLEAAGE